MTQSSRAEGVVKMNPLGPHFYVDSDDEKPAGMVDVVTDTMNQMLSEVDADSRLTVEHGHIKCHEPITQVSWTVDERGRLDDLQVECPEPSAEWHTDL